MKYVTRPVFKNFLCIICATLLLVGCSYFDPAEPDANDKDWVSGGVEAVPAAPAPAPVNVPEVISRATNGRVQLYSLDGAQMSWQAPAANTGGAAEVAPVDAQAKPGSMMPEDGIANHSTSSVQIFQP